MPGPKKVEKLRAALDQCQVIELRRFIRRADRLSGFVVGVGKRWVLIHLVDDVVLNGYSATRIADIRKVRTKATEGSFTLRALDHYGERPTPLAGVDLSNLTSLVVGLQRTFPLVSVFTEVDDPEVRHIGRVTRMTAQRFELLELDAEANWAEKPTRWKLADITRLDVGGRYEMALAALGGDPTLAQDVP